MDPYFFVAFTMIVITLFANFKMLKKAKDLWIRPAIPEKCPSFLSVEDFELEAKARRDWLKLVLCLIPFDFILLLIVAIKSLNTTEQLSVPVAISLVCLYVIFKINLPFYVKYHCAYKKRGVKLLLFGVVAAPFYFFYMGLWIVNSHFFLETAWPYFTLIWTLTLLDCSMVVLYSIASYRLYKANSLRNKNLKTMIANL